MPYAHCAALTSRSTHERRAEFTLQTLHLRLAEILPGGITLGEVMPSPLIRSHGPFQGDFPVTLSWPPVTAHADFLLRTLERPNHPPPACPASNKSKPSWDASEKTAEG